MSGEEMARYLSKKVEAEARREKAGYKQRALAARKYGKSVGGGKNFRAVRSVDVTTYLRHEIERPGCMSDSEYSRNFAQKNPETVMGS